MLRHQRRRAQCAALALAAVWAVPLEGRADAADPSGSAAGPPPYENPSGPPPYGPPPAPPGYGPPPYGPPPAPAYGPPPGPGPYDPPPGYPPYYPPPYPVSPYPEAAFAEPLPADATAPQEVSQTASQAAAFTGRYDFGVTWSFTSVSETRSLSVVNAPLVAFAYAFAPSLVFDLAWGFAWMVDGEGLSESTVRSGNPMLTGTYQRQMGPWLVRAGLGVTAPVASVPLGNDGRLYAFVYNHTLATSGMWNAWLWFPSRVSVPASVMVRRHWGDGHDASMDGALAATHAVRGDGDRDDLVAQLAMEARLHLGRRIWLSPRLQSVLLPDAGTDRLQTSAALRLIVGTRIARFFAGVLVNLDPPLGISGGLGRWGVHLGKEMDL